MRSIESTKSTKDSGFTLVEVVVALGLFLVLVVGLISIRQLSVRSSELASLRVKSTTTLRETMEQTMAVRAGNFSVLNEGTYHPKVVDGEWSLVAGNEVVGDLTRWVEINKIQRQLSCGGERVCPIVRSGGVVDPVTFRAKVVVEWEERDGTKREELESLLTFWR